MATRTCNQCGQEFVWMSIEDGSFKPHNINGTRHICDVPVTRASDVRVTPPISTIDSTAKDAVLNMVAQVTESFQRTIQTKSDELFDSINSATVSAQSKHQREIEWMFKEAKEEFSRLMPQQHEIVIHAPDVSTTIPNSRPHYQLQRLVDWLNIRSHVWAAGPAGSGKTTAAEMAATALHLPYYELVCGMGTNDWSLLGHKSPTTGEYIPGHLRQPFEHGGVLCLDELDNTQPSVLVTLNGALSSNKYTFPDQVVPRHPDFVVVGCANTWGHGANRQYMRNQIDAATLDRFRKITWNYDEEAEWDWAGRDQSPWISYVQEVRSAANRMGMRTVISPRASIEGAKGLRNGLSRVVVSEDCLWNGLSEDDAQRLQSEVGKF